jgi:cytochrome P450
MSSLGQALGFAANLYRQRAEVAYAGYVRRQPFALLQLRPGRADPYPLYERIRDRGPLTSVGGGELASADYRVCDAVVRDRRFGAGPADGTGKDEMDLSFLGMNPPDHTRLRRLVMPAFSPKAVASYTERIERTVGGLLDRASEAGRFDLVSEFAAPLPIAVITDLLGIPDAESAAFSRYGALIGSVLGGVRSLRHARRLMATEAPLVELFEGLFELRRREPREDLVSRLVATADDQIKPAELIPMCLLLLVAGFETTVNLIGNGVLALLSHPEQWRALCADPDGLTEKAVEETLRFDSPVQITTRFALQPVEFEGKVLGQNQTVNVLIGGANRDPAVYEKPDTFDLSRAAAVGNLAFSGGIHYCPGQPLARLEAAIALRALAERMPGLARTGPVEWRGGVVIRGPLRFPVAAAARRTAAGQKPAGQKPADPQPAVRKD